MTDIVSATQPPGNSEPSSARLFWRAFGENKGAVFGLCIIVVIVAGSILASLLAPYPADAQFRDLILQPPAWQEGGSWSHILGTDDIGRDVLSRIIYGSRVSLLVGGIVVTLSLVVGVSLGLVAGYRGGKIDFAIMRVMDMILALPSILLAIVIVTVLGPGLSNAMIAVSLVKVPTFTRITRAAVLAELTKDYVTASRLAGAGPVRLMLTTVLPNCWPPIIVVATLGFSDAILDAAALGFLGLGAQPPTPEWGAMLADSRQYIEHAWWVVTFPGMAILVTVLACNLLGDGLRDALDPKLRR